MFVTHASKALAGIGAPPRLISSFATALAWQENPQFAYNHVERIVGQHRLSRGGTDWEAQGLLLEEVSSSVAAARAGLSMVVLVASTLALNGQTELLERASQAAVGGRGSLGVPGAAPPRLCSLRPAGRGSALCAPPAAALLSVPRRPRLPLPQPALAHELCRPGCRRCRAWSWWTAPARRTCSVWCLARGSPPQQSCPRPSRSTSTSTPVRLPPPPACRRCARSGRR